MVAHQISQLALAVDLKLQCDQATVDITTAGNTICLDCADWQSLLVLFQTSRDTIGKSIPTEIANLLARFGWTLEIRQSGRLQARIGYSASNRLLQVLGFPNLELRQFNILRLFWH